MCTNPSISREVYGGNPKLRARLDEAGIPYVMAVARSDIVAMATGGGIKS